MKHFTKRDLVRAQNRISGESTPLPPERKKRGNEESRTQIAVMRWWSIAHDAFEVPECCLFAVGNGGRRDPIGGAILKREGVKPGVSDLLLMAKRGNYGALALEMKKPGGRLSSAQQAFLHAMTGQGYYACVAYSYDEATRTITRYLRGEL